MKTALLAFTCIAVAVFWFVEKSTGANLSAQLDTVRQERRGFSALLREQQRLHGLQHELQDVRLTEGSATRGERNNAESPSARTPEAMVLGEWVPSSAWTNRGCTTAANTIETMMWAAAGGDVENLRRVLDLDDATTIKLDQLLATLPEATRALYPTAKHLVAAFTAKAIPLGEAQLVWQQQLGPDDALACVWSENAIADQTSPGDKNTGPNSPLGSSYKTKSIFVILRRMSEGWQIVVPPRAVEALAKDVRSDAKVRR
jgi:hypothetical protein